MQVPVLRDLPGGRHIEAVGEAFYTAALHGLASLGPMVRWAELVPDLDNLYDPNAVCVVIDGVHVGHLDPATAIEFRPVADRIHELGCEVRCASSIVEDSRLERRDCPTYTVVLDIGTPEECLSALDTTRIRTADREIIPPLVAP